MYVSNTFSMGYQIGLWHRVCPSICICVFVCMYLQKQYIEKARQHMLAMKRKRVSLCVCVCMCVRACVRICVCMHACMHVCMHRVHVCVSVHVCACGVWCPCAYTSSRHEYQSLRLCICVQTLHDLFGIV